jgi:hypothetical protein
VPVFSNRARPVSFVSGIDATCWPGTPEPECKGSSNEPVDVAADVSESGAGVIAWVKPADAAPEPPAPPGFTVEELTAAADGALYCVTPSSPAAGAGEAC